MARDIFFSYFFHIHYPVSSFSIFDLVVLKHGLFIFHDKQEVMKDYCLLSFVFKISKSRVGNNHMVCCKF